MCSVRMPWRQAQFSNVALMYSGPFSQRITSGLPRQAMICVSIRITRYDGSEKSTSIPIIPPRKNARMRKGPAFTHRNAAIAACRWFGRKIRKVWSGYHRRSLVGTKMNCIKRLGERVMSRTFERQVNELHIRAAILNRFTELGRPQTVAVA